MTARILVVDDIPTNVKLLEARLTAEYYDVVSVFNGADALAAAERGDIDLILLDVMMPEMDGFEVCRRLKADRRTAHLPVVMVTALDQPADRVQGLEAGADDFLTKPIDDIALMARVKSLVRLKVLSDELRSRAVTGQSIAMEDAMETVHTDNGRILLVDSDPRSAERIRSAIADDHEVVVVTDPTDTTMRAADDEFELGIVSMALGDYDPLRVCSQLRTLDQTRLMPLILVADMQDRTRVLRGLELGVNDFIQRPLERNELAARVRTQIRRHRYSVALRTNLSNTMALAVIDELTGLYNRRYFDRHFSMLLGKAKETGRPLSLLMLDIDYFKSVNDNFGHDVGDSVLKEFAARLQRNTRGVDLACRFGGEEFVVLMPDTDLDHAQAVAERIRDNMEHDPIDAGFGDRLVITVSAGIALDERGDDTPETMLKRADVALYRAKREGRNRVIYDAA